MIFNNLIDATMYAHFLFNAFDDRKEGFICFEDFIFGLSSLLRGKIDEKLKWAFRLYDINQDGFITKNEIQDIVKSVYMLLGCSVHPPLQADSYISHAESVFMKLDKNGDGYITYPEFLEACKNDVTVVKSMKIFDLSTTEIC